MIKNTVLTWGRYWIILKLNTRFKSTDVNPTATSSGSAKEKRSFMKCALVSGGRKTGEGGGGGEVLTQHSSEVEVDG